VSGSGRCPSPPAAAATRAKNLADQLARHTSCTVRGLDHLREVYTVARVMGKWYAGRDKFSDEPYPTVRFSNDGVELKRGLGEPILR